MVKVGCRESGDLGLTPSGCWNLLLPQGHFAQHALTRALFILLCSLYYFFLDFVSGDLTLTALDQNVNCFVEETNEWIGGFRFVEETNEWIGGFRRCRIDFNFQDCVGCDLYSVQQRSKIKNISLTLQSWRLMEEVQSSVHSTSVFSKALEKNCMILL